MKVKLTPNPSGRRGVALTVEHMGTETITYFNAPSRSIDHVDVAYLQRRGLWNVTTKKQLKYIQEEFKKYMQNLSDTIPTNQQIQFYSIPKWAKYIAYDETGWWAFENKPYLCDNNTGWRSNGKCEQVHPVLPTTLKEVNR